jgi:hypothetical protein
VKLTIRAGGTTRAGVWPAAGQIDAYISTPVNNTL